MEEETTLIRISKKLIRKVKKIAAENDSSIKDLVESAIKEKYDL